jgi:hypothetical protein
MSLEGTALKIDRHIGLGMQGWIESLEFLNRNLSKYSLFPLVTYKLNNLTTVSSAKDAWLDLLEMSIVDKHNLYVILEELGSKTTGSVLSDNTGIISNFIPPFLKDPIHAFE